MSARFYAWRAALRLARRDAWRNKGRSALVALMIALPVLALSTVSVLYRSDGLDPRDNVRVQLGMQAQALITYGDGSAVMQAPDAQNRSGGGRPDGVDALTLPAMDAKIAPMVPARDRLVPDRSLDTNHNLLLGDRMIGGSVREIDYTADGLGGLIDQVAGRAPQQAGEVVISENLADANVRVGDTLTYRASSADSPKDLTVVGIVGGYNVHGFNEVIGLPGTLLPAAAFTGPANTAYQGAQVASELLVVGPDPVTWDDVLDLNQGGATVLSRDVVAHPPPWDRVPLNQENYSSSVDSGAVGIVAVVIGLVLLQIALLAGPAIAVGARRNQHSLALLASAGAERRHLRAVVLATNGVIALASCGFAAIAGTGLGVAIIEVIRARGGQIVRIDVHPLDLLLLIAAGLFTAVGASLIPARQAARLDVVAALTGRRGYSPPALRVPLLGLLLAGAGAALALASSTRRWQFPTVLGLAVTEIGLVVASGSVVALAAKLAARMPFSARFALRDAARQRSRTAPAVAAVLAAIAGGSAALVYVAAQDDHDRQSYQPSTATGVVTVDLRGYFDDTVQPSLPKAEAVIRRELPGSTVTRFRTVKMDSDGNSDSLNVLPSPDTVCRGEGGTTSPVDPAVGLCPAAPAQSDSVSVDFQHGDLFDDGTAVQALTRGMAPASVAGLKAGKVVSSDPNLIWPDGTVHVQVERWTDDTDEWTTGPTVTWPAVLAPAGEQSRNGLVYPLAAARRLGVPLETSGLLATPATVPTKHEEERVNDLLAKEAGLQMYVERGYVSDYGLGLLALLVAATVISLVGTFTAVGLAAAETKADVSTLAAVGAGPGVRRRLAAAQAGVISGLGGVLGVASGILAGWVLIRMQSAQAWRLVLPWPYLFAVGLGIPLVAVVIGFLTTRSRLPMVRRLAQ